MESLKSVTVTFLIGVVAGVSPFLFMQLLPALLNPSQPIAEPNYLAIVLTGILVGAISSIIFAKTFDKRDPHDIFFYTLGIPAVLIATVSNMSTKFEAARSVTAAQVAASNTVLNVAPPQVEALPLQETTPPPKPAPGSSLPTNDAWAEERAGVSATVAQVGGGYLVVIGRYASNKEAWRALEELRLKRLKTELYVQKNPRVFQASANLYYLTYSSALSREDAIKLYNLIRINDPQLTPEVLRQSGK